MTHIYGLLDPRTSELRYVGKANNPEQRLVNHMNEISRCHRSHWLQRLKRDGMKPSLQILEVVADDVWEDAERSWIKFFRETGARLVNGTSGGDGVRDLSSESRERIRSAWIGRKHREESKFKISQYRKTWNPSAEVRAAMSRAHTGRSFNGEWINKIAAANRRLTREQVGDILQRVNLGVLNTQIAKLFMVSRLTISKIRTGKYFLDHSGPDGAHIYSAQAAATAGIQRIRERKPVARCTCCHLKRAVFAEGRCRSCVAERAMRESKKETLFDQTEELPA